MMRNLKTITKILLAALLMPVTLAAQQAGMTIVGLSGQNMTVTGSTLYLPAGSYLNNTGNLYIATNQLVAGNAGTTITGVTGSRLHLLGANQLDATAPASPTLADLNSVAIDIDITSYNPQNLQLTDQAFGTVITDGAANFSASKEFAFGTAHPFTAIPVTDNHILTNNNQFIIGSNGMLTGFDLNRYVVTNNNAGELRKLGLITGQNFFFPIGRAEADYTPGRMQVVSGGPVDYYMNVRNFAESSPDESLGGYSSLPNVSRTWLIYGSNAASVANMDFIHPGIPAYEVNGYTHNSSNVIRFNGNGWVPNTVNDAENESLFGTPANYWAQQLTYPVFSTPGSNTFFGKSNSLIVLPVILEKFDANDAGCNSLINWTTASEQNTRQFNVERSYSGTSNSWVTVNTVQAAGNSSSPRQYMITDNTANSRLAYYRLAIIDIDGNKSYSPVRLVRFSCGNQKDIVVYPNPIQNYVNILLPQDLNKYSIRIMNAAGQAVVPTVANVNGVVTLQTERLPLGYYVIIVTGEDGISTSFRIIKN